MIRDFVFGNNVFIMEWRNYPSMNFIGNYGLWFGYGLVRVRVLIWAGLRLGI